MIQFTMMLMIKIFFSIALSYLVILLLLYYSQEKFIFFPQGLSKDSLASVSAMGKTVENIEIKFDEGKYLRGWLKKVDGSGRQKLIIYFGGNAEEVSYMLYETEKIYGWSVALINYRGYGLSDGISGEKELFEDSVRIYDYFAGRKDIDKTEIALMGRSLGCGVAVYLASMRKIRKVILISPYDSITSVAKVHYGIFPVSLILKHRFDSVSYAPKINTPLFYIYGLKDDIIPYRHSEELAKYWKGGKEKLELPDAGHNNILEGKEVWKRMNDFLRK